VPASTKPILSYDVPGPCLRFTGPRTYLLSGEENIVIEKGFVAVGIEVAEGGIIVSVGVIGVADGSTGVFVAGIDGVVRCTGVAVGGIAVSVGGRLVTVAGINVTVGGIGVAVGGISVLLGGPEVNGGGIDVPLDLTSVGVAKIRADDDVLPSGIGVAVLTCVLASRCTSRLLLISPSAVSISVIKDTIVSKRLSGALE